jgi:hypothetical protein
MKSPRTPWQNLPPPFAKSVCPEFLSISESGLNPSGGCTMTLTLFSARDLREIRERGMTPEEVMAQVERFRKGFPFCHLDRPCTVGDGIVALNPSEIERLSRAHAEAASAGRLMQFVPASGAATRMFKSLLSFQGHAAAGKEWILPAEGGPSIPEETDVRRFIRGIRAASPPNRF